MKYIVRITYPKFALTLWYVGMDEDEVIVRAKKLVADEPGYEARISESRFFGLIERYVTTVR